MNFTKIVIALSVLANIAALLFLLGFYFAPLDVLGSTQFFAGSLERELNGISNSDIEFFRPIAIEAVSSCTQGSELCKYTELEIFVLENIKYIGDPLNSQEIVSPHIAFARGYGDCEEIATAYCSLANGIGLECTVKVTPDLAHTFTETSAGNFLELNNYE